jgi:hypothetical protein
MSIAAEHVAEAADALRAAAGIADPYKRADAIWGAVERINAAAERLGGRPAACCAGLARRLEEGCEAGREPPNAEELQRHASDLDRIASDPNAAGPGREPNRASQLDRPRGREEP